MEVFVPQQSGAVKILCCECGVPIEANPANMCIGCIKGKVDISEGIPKTGQLNFCKFCERYLQPPSAWIPAALESKELLSICLKRLKGLNKVRLIDAGFIWTEPHSKRIKVKLTVQKEIMGGAIVQQVFVVEYVVHSQMCEQCQRVEAKDFWRACVQVRQKVEHKKTIFFLEQLVLKHRLHVETTGIKPISGGIDFFYSKLNSARKLVDFLQTVLPCRYTYAQELVSHDTHSNTYDYKHSFCVELVPICKDDVVCLPKKLAQSLGNLGQLCICYRVSNCLHLIDPKTGQIADISSTVYWRSPFESLSTPKQLVEYTVIDVEPTARGANFIPPPGHGQVSNRHMLVDAWVSKTCELGTDTPQCVRSHLGHWLKPGDSVLGFDLTSANVNNPELETVKAENLPDVVLVKKIFGDKSFRNRRRLWRLKHLGAEDQLESNSIGNEYTEFLEDLEEDPEMRKHVNIYKDSRKGQKPTETAEEEEAGMPQVSLEEMLEDLQLDDAEMPEEWEDVDEEENQQNQDVNMK